NAFDVLGVTAALGRVLHPSDDVTVGVHPVAVVSHAFWMRQLGGDPGAIGRWIQLEQKPYQIVGVAQAGFTGGQPGGLTDIWIPNMMNQADPLTNAHWQWLHIWGRLSPGATRQALRPVILTTLANLDDETKTSIKATGQQAAESAIDVVDASTGLSEV